jgi:hypothetical protein
MRGHRPSLARIAAASVADMPQLFDLIWKSSMIAGALESWRFPL